MIDSLGNLKFLPDKADGRFFRAKESEKEHLRFWDLFKTLTSRAVFLGIERPNTTSLQQNPYNANTYDLVEEVSNMSLQNLIQNKGKKTKTVWKKPADEN
jgi:hypothetical protein